MQGRQAPEPVLEEVEEAVVRGCCVWAAMVYCMLYVLNLGICMYGVET